MSGTSRLACGITAAWLPIGSRPRPRAERSAESPLTGGLSASRRPGPRCRRLTSARSRQPIRRNVTRCAADVNVGVPKAEREERRRDIRETLESALASMRRGEHGGLVLGELEHRQVPEHLRVVPRIERQLAHPRDTNQPLSVVGDPIAGGGRTGHDRQGEIATQERREMRCIHSLSISSRSMSVWLRA